MPIENLVALAKQWLKDFEKGKKGERAVARYLTKQTYFAMPIVHYKVEEQDKIYTTEQKKETAQTTVFAPDFLVVSQDGKEIFFAEAKWKKSKRFLGWINCRDYDKIWKIMQRLKGIGFKIFFWVEEEKSIYVYEKLEEPKGFDTTIQPDGLVYIIPKDKLRLVYQEETQ
jgi:hypothetical protein